MRRKASLSHEKLVEETRFVLENLQRDDVFGSPARISEVERVLQPSLSLGFADFLSFLGKYGYVRVGPETGTVAVTSGGRAAASSEDAEFQARLARHFARELTSTTARPRPEPPTAPLSDYGSTSSSTAVVRPRRPTLVDPAPFDEVLDRRYRRLAPLGRGPLGQVFRGRHVGVGRPIALKEASTVFQLVSYLRRDEIVARLRAAVTAHAGLIHPHVVAIFDQNTEREHPYFVMELAPGGSLRQRLALADGRLELATAARILSQIAEALRFAHSQGVLHLGLKPENVLFDARGNVKVADFGMARILEHPGDGPAPMLVGGNAVGYFAPERLQPGEAPQMTPAADIYALGICFYEMLTGRLPGRRSPLPSKAREGVPEAFDEVFDRMTHDDLDERYASMEEVIEGVHATFGAELVGPLGSVLAWAEDPGPVPPQPEPEEVEAEDVMEMPETIDEDEFEALPTPMEVARVVSAPPTSALPMTGDLDTERSRAGTLPSGAGTRPPPPPPAED